MPTQTVPQFETIMKSKTTQAGCWWSWKSSGANKHQKKKKNPHTINNLSIIVESALKEIREFCNWDLNQAWESAKIS